MSYEKTTIRNVIDRINNGEIYLPVIQRQFVWNDRQITNYFDSILRGYPIGSFLFWDLKNTTINDNEYLFYKFIQDYHERDNFINHPAPNPMIKEKIVGVLDGQQRLTSLYISLQGSISRKLPRKWKNSDDSYVKKELYFNLLCENFNREDDLDHNFAFLTLEESINAQKQIWFKVKDILQMNKLSDLNSYIRVKGLLENELVQSNLVNLWEQICCKDLVSYFKVMDNSMDNVLDIFIRVNSGGSILSKTDLLFSTIVSHWENARNEITSLLNSINKIGEKYQFNNDFIMRACLYLLDMPIDLKVANFKKRNIEIMKSNWKKIKESIITTVQLLDEFGFSDENIISYNAIIPIIYYIYKKGNQDENSKLEWKKYFIISQVKQLFGSASNNALTLTRNSLREKVIIANEENDIVKYKLKSDKFRIEQFYLIKFSGLKTIKFSEEEIDELFEIKKGPYTFLLLSLLYSNIKFSQRSFHQDHMHPQSSFKENNLKLLGINSQDIIKWQENKDKLPNLHILEGKENISKNSKSLIDWAKVDSNKAQIRYVPSTESLELANFNNFYEKRKDELKTELIRYFM